MDGGIEGRNDAGSRKVDFGLFQRGLGGIDGSLGNIQLGLAQEQFLFFSTHIASQQFILTLRDGLFTHFHAQVALGLIQRALLILQGQLIIARVDLQNLLALLKIATLLEGGMHFDNIAAHLRR